MLDPALDLVLISWDGLESPAQHLQLDEPARFQLLLFDYSGKAQRPVNLPPGWPEQWCWLSRTTACKGEILEVLSTWLEVRLPPGCYLGLIDDDVVISVSQINRALERGYQLGSVCFSPTLDPAHKAWVPHMLSQGGQQPWRTVPWVDLKMSFVRVDLFAATAPFYPLSISSYGIDYFVQPYFARVFDLPGDFHVFDDIVVESNREDRSRSRIFANGLSAVEEGRRLGRLCLSHLLKQRPDLLSDAAIRRLLNLPPASAAAPVRSEVASQLWSMLRDRDQRRQLLRELNGDQDLADALLQLLLGVQGYNNSRNARISGEHFWLTVVLPRLGVRHCLDVGAAQGQYSRLLLQSLPQCRVFACEPLPQNGPQLDALAREYPQRFYPCSWALGGQEGLASLHYESARPQLATFCEGLTAIDYLANDHTVVVPVRRLDDWWLASPNPEPLDFIKIDSEGWEADILDGGAQTISRLRPVAIQLEFNRHHLFRGHTFLSLAQRLDGYGVFQLLPNRMARRDPAAPLTNLFEFSNFVFIRSDCIATVEAVVEAAAMKPQAQPR